MADRMLSSRQRAILEAMAAGATLRWVWVDAPHSLGAWRNLLAGKPVDGRSVWGLVQRGYVELVKPQRSSEPNAWELSEAGRQAVQSGGWADES